MFPSTITITIATGEDRILNRVNQDNYGSEYTLPGATDQCTLKIRHSQDSPDADGLVMKRHNVFFERIVYPTETTALQKQTYTATLRQSDRAAPNIVSDVAKGINAWLGTATNMQDLASGIN